MNTARRWSTRSEMKNHFVAMLGEFVGTTLFLMLALGGANVANTSQTNVTNSTTPEGTTSANTSNLLYIALSFGFSLAVNIWVFARVSGGHLNPAVSVGLCLAGAITPVRMVLVMISQILGGIAGSAIILGLTPGSLYARTSLGGGTTVVQGLFIEMFLTAMLVLTVLMLAAEKHKATFLAPIGIGLALFVAELAGVYYTGGSLNPARSFGPNVVLRKFESYHYIYWVGPFLGALLAVAFYKLLKYLKFETVMGLEEEQAAVNATERTRVVPGNNTAPDSTLSRMERIEAMLTRLVASNSGSGRAWMPLGRKDSEYCSGTETVVESTDPGPVMPVSSRGDGTGMV